MYTTGALGLAFVLLGVFSLVATPAVLVGSTYLSLGLLYGALFLRQYYFGYAELTEEWIQKKEFFSKPFIFSEITAIKRFTDEVTLVSRHRKLKFHTSVMDSESRAQFERFTKSFDMENNKKRK
mgnify:CR=1 FL=1